MQKSRQFHILIVVAFLVIFLRFYYFQIHEYSKYEIKSGNNSLRKISLYAPRGIIYDKNGIPLVDNKQIYDLSLIPFDVSDKFNYDILTSLVGLSQNKLREVVNNKKKAR